MRLVIAPLLALLGLFAGCGGEGVPLSAPPPTTSVAEKTPPTGRAQPKLPTIKLWLGANEIVAEQALSEQEIRAGMMFRTEMGENEGMLFVFAGPMRASFWMRNTLLPLSCAYIDPEGVILEIRDMKPLDESPIEAQSDRVQYVLEMRQGWFDRHDVKPGMLVRTERGSLRETYFGR